MFGRILCATDFSPASEKAARVAMRLAKDNHAEFVFAHLAGDKPADAITEQANQQGFDLCVVGVRAVVEQVVRHALCSVLAVHPDGEVKPFSHALVPIDFSANSRHAIELATQIVDTPGTIMLLHVLELPGRFEGEVPKAAFNEDMNRRAADSLNDAAQALKRTTLHKVETRMRIGYPGHEILQVLDEDRSFDLVAMGSHGRTGLKRVLLGSVAEKITRRARCSVLVSRLHGRTLDIAAR